MHFGRDLRCVIESCLQRSSQSYTLPTWVIDWAAFDKADVFASLAATGQFNSTRGSRAEVSFSYNGRCTLSGMFVDIVGVVGIPISQDSYGFRPIFGKRPGTAVLLHFVGWLKTLVDHIGVEALQKSTYFTGEDYLDVAFAMYQATRTSYESRWYRPGVQAQNRVSDERIYNAAKALISTFPSAPSAYLHPRWYKGFWAGMKTGVMLGFGPYDYQIVHERNVMVSKQGHLGMCPCDTRAGDRITILNGGKVPLILRPGNKPEEFSLLGEAYVHGIMQGERYNESECVPITLVREQIAK